MSETPLQNRLIQALTEPSVSPLSRQAMRVIETHISTVILTEDHAYKLKKPLDMGFLNFSELEDRRFFCEEELRLNRRLAPDLYLDVVCFTDDVAQPRINGDGEVLDYAVRMRRFPDHSLLSDAIADGELRMEWMPILAQRMADFHQRAAVATADQAYGEPETALFPMQQNFDQLRGLITDAEAIEQLNRLESWTQNAYAEQQQDLAQRKANGFVRECHGDMHLGNIAQVDGDLQVFDGIEFNPNFRWIDVISENAFFLMDMDYRDASAYGWRYFNEYLQITGDYEALRLLRFYQVYRAMVRAKVSSIRLAQGNLSDDERQGIMADYLGFTSLAEHYTQDRKAALVLMRGVSGSGKSTVARQLAADLSAVHIRSDSHRKRLFGLQQTESSDSGLNQNLYTAESTQLVYDALRDSARVLLNWGFTVVVDATFLKQAQIDAFSTLAQEANCALCVVETHADAATLKQRIEDRAAQGNDASEATLAVMQQQLQQQEPLPESLCCIRTRAYDTGLLRALREALES